jgi:PKD repeat protein
MSIRELFRNKLENSEIIPGESVNTELMHKLAHREFLSFTPSKINIYYLGGIIAAGLITVLLLTTSPKPGEKPTFTTPSETIMPVDTVSMNILKQQTTGENVKKNTAETIKPADNKKAVKQNIIENIKPAVIKSSDIKLNIPQSGKSDSISRKTMIRETIYERNNIQTLQTTVRAAFDVSRTTGCIPLKVKFLNRSISYDSCRWVFGDGGFSTEKDPEWFFDMEGEYKVVLRVFGSNDNEATSSAVITVHPKPVARFEINPENPILPDDEIHFLNYSMDAIKYKWEFGDGNTSVAFEPDHRYNKYANYNVRLIVWSEYGCSDSLMVINTFSTSGCYVDFPNAFIPNPDGPTGGYYSTKTDETAQVFHPVTSGVSDFQLKIFSKLGVLIFESNDVNFGWDGYLKGQLCEQGVYIWKVRGTYKNGEPFVKMGDVTLLKNK